MHDFALCYQGFWNLERKPLGKSRTGLLAHFSEWNTSCGSVDMLTNTPALRISIGLGVAAGAALTTMYVARRRRQNRSLLARARRQANALIRNQITRLVTDSASAWIARGRDEAVRQKRGVIHAVSAGRNAYQKAAG
jgi:hypothetical protein